jgi:hypothetical protein
MDFYLNGNNFESICKRVTDRLFLLGSECNEPNINSFWNAVLLNNEPLIFLNNECKDSSLKEKMYIIIKEIIGPR